MKISPYITLVAHIILGWLFVAIISPVLSMETGDDMIFFTILYLTGVIGYWGHRISEAISELDTKQKE